MEGNIKVQIKSPLYFNYLTPTAIELASSVDFWSRRGREQHEYIEGYLNSHHTRPDQDAVIDSAIDILKRCGDNINEINNSWKEMK